jgi:hypothetical protein
MTIRTFLQFETLANTHTLLSVGQTIFYLCFLCAELPSQLISKKLGPDNWIPVQMVSWSLVASMQAFLSGRASFWTCRALLGLIEGGL